MNKFQWSKNIGFVLERDYYKPIVDHKIARNEALAAFKKLRSKWKKQ